MRMMRAMVAETRIPTTSSSSTAGAETIHWLLQQPQLMRSPLLRCAYHKSCVSAGVEVDGCPRCRNKTSFDTYYYHHMEDWGALPSGSQDKPIKEDQKDQFKKKFSFQSTKLHSSKYQ